MNEEKNVTNTVALGDQIQLMSTATPTSDDVRLYSDLIGWMNDNDDRLALPIGAAINLCAVNDSCCSCDSRWSSSDNSVATVSSSGTITAKAVGTVTITATVGCSSVRCKVTVVEGDIAIIKSKDHNIVGKTIQLKAVTANPDQTVTWSSDSDAASVNSNGTVTVKKIGAFRITASVSGLRTQTVTLYGALSDGVYNIKGKQSAMYFGIAAPNTDTDGEGLKKASVTSYSTGSGVDQMWHLRYQSNGEYVIRSYARPLLALTSDISDSKNVSVDMFTTKTTSYPSECKWTITNESSGFVLKNVSTQAALSQNDNRYWAISAVSNPPKELVVLDLQTGKYIANGETIKLKLGDYYKTRAIYRSPDTIDQLFTWLEGDGNIAIVNVKGYISTHNAGETTITVKSQSSNLTLNFNVVIWIPVQSVTIIPRNCFRIAKGKVYTMTAKITPNNATNQKLTWKSSNNSVFGPTEISYSSSCEFEAKEAGTATITVTTEDGGYSDSCIVEVKEKEDVRITRDGKYFKVAFEDHTTWESVEHNMDDSAIRSNAPLFGLNAEEDENYANMHDFEKRFVNNTKNSYSMRQLAFLFLLDPYGVSYYVKNYNEYNPKMSETDILNFKDELYYNIYKVTPAAFVISSNGKRQKIFKDGLSRYDYFTDAELLFGAHNIVDHDKIVVSILDLIFDLSMLAIKAAFPYTTPLIDAYSKLEDKVVEFYFPVSLANQFGDKAESKFMDLLNGEIKPQSAASLIFWAKDLYDIIDTFGSRINDVITHLDTSKSIVLDSVASRDYYNAIFYTNGKLLSLNDFLGYQNGK